MPRTLTDRTTIIYLIVSTLAEGETGEAPESFVYLPLAQQLDVNLHEFHEIVRLAIDVGWLERRTGPVLRLTSDGRKLVRDVESACKVQS